MKYILLLALVAFSKASYSQSGYPKSDTSKGVVVYYNDELNVKADSAMLITMADKTICQAAGIVDCGISLGHKCQPNWYEWRVILFRRDNLVIPVKSKISFHPNKR